MDKIDVTQTDIDAWEIYGPQIFHCEMTGPEALAAHRATRTDATPVATDVAALVEAAKAILHAVCHETGFAAAVRADSGLAYPWEPLDIAEAQLRQALAPFTKGQNDE